MMKVCLEAENENENFKTFLKLQKYTSRKKSLLKKQISDLKTYLDDHLPRIQEEEQMANIFQFKASNANIKQKNYIKSHMATKKNTK